GVDDQGTGTVLRGNKIGTDVTGTQVFFGNFGYGAWIHGNSSGAFIAGNLISGNFGDNVHLDFGTSATRIQGNKIGTDITGTKSLQTFFGFFNFGFNGIAIEGSSGNVIGGPDAGDGNLISGNNFDGVLLSGGSSGNLIQG